MVDQIAQGMFEGAGQELFVEVDREEFQSFVNGLESRHCARASLRLNELKSISLYKGRQQVFLQPQRLS